MRATPARALLIAGCALTLVATSGCAEEDETNIDVTTDTTAVVDLDPAYDDAGAMAGDSVDVDGDGDFDEVRAAADAVGDAADATQDAVRGAADATADAASDAANATEDAAREVADEVDDVVTGD